MNLIRTLMDTSKPLVRVKRRVLGPTRPTWSVELETIVTVMRYGANLSVLLPLRVQRAIIDPKRPDSPIVTETRIEARTLAGLRAYTFSRPESQTDRVVIYLHGGGYSVGSVNSHRDLIARLCEGLGCRIVALEYRLAPESPYPAQLEDALAAYRALRAEGYAASAIGLAGESAGAGLAMSLMLALRDAAEEAPAAAVLISPWVDLEARGRSFDENARYDFVQRRAMEAYARRFVPRTSLRDPLASPVHARLSSLPPVLVQVGEVETLRDDGILLAQRIIEAGGVADLEVYPDMVHAFHVFAPFLPEAQRAITRAAAFLSERLAP